MPPGSPPGFGLLCASISAAADAVAMIEAPSLRWGSATWMALMVPTKLVLMPSVQACSGGWPFMPAMPACATTMSTLPSSFSPASSASRNCAASRTSALCGDDAAGPSSRRSARSPRDPPEWPTGSRWCRCRRQRSTAMMSAPSSASRTAWLRPCPRAAPVMNATLPATRPTVFPSCWIRLCLRDGFETDPESSPAPPGRSMRCAPSRSGVKNLPFDYENRTLGDRGHARFVD